MFYFHNNVLKNNNPGQFCFVHVSKLISIDFILFNKQGWIVALIYNTSRAQCKTVPDRVD